MFKLVKYNGILTFWRLEENPHEISVILVQKSLEADNSESSYDTFWFNMVPYGTLWYIMVPYGTLWYLMLPHGTLWYLMVPYGTLWYLMVPYGT